MDNLKPETCPCCGWKTVQARGKHPDDPPRTVCPTCLADFMDWIIAHGTQPQAQAARGGVFTPETDPNNPQTIKTPPIASSEAAQWTKTRP